MSASTAQQAGTQAKHLIARSLPGSRKANQDDLRKAEQIGDTIWRRWQASPTQWQLKHVRWYLEHTTEHLSASRRYKHWLTLRRLIQVLGKYDDWVGKLHGPWLRPDGNGAKPLEMTGRPARRPT